MVEVDPITDANCPGSSPSGVELHHDAFHYQEPSSGATWISIDSNGGVGVRGAVDPVRSHGHSFRGDADKKFHHSVGDLEWLEENNSIDVDLEMKLRIGYALMMKPAYRPKSVPTPPTPPPPPKEISVHTRSCHSRLESFATSPNTKTSRRSPHPRDDPKRKKAGKEKNHSKSFESITRPTATHKEDTLHSITSLNDDLNKVTKRSKSSEDLRSMLSIASPADPNRKKASKGKKRSNSSETLRNIPKATKYKSEKRDRSEHRRSCAKDSNETDCHGTMEELRKEWAERAKMSRSSPTTIPDTHDVMGTPSRSRPSRDELSTSEHFAPLSGGDDCQGTWGSSSEHGMRSRTSIQATRKAGPLRGVSRNKSMDDELADSKRSSHHHKSPKNGASSTIKKSNSYGDLIPVAPISTPTKLAKRRNKTGSCSTLLNCKGASFGVTPQPSRQKNATFGETTVERSSISRGSLESKTEQRRAEVRKSLFSRFGDDFDKDFMDFLQGAPANPAPPASSPHSVMIHKE